jgi:hypothetical protein
LGGDSYRRSVKRRKETKGSQSPTEIRKLKYEEQMSFCTHVFREGQPLTSLFMIMTMMEMQKKAKKKKEQSAESPVTETTDESIAKSKREKNTNNLKKSENLLQQF